MAHAEACKLQKDRICIHGAKLGRDQLPHAVGCQQVRAPMTCRRVRWRQVKAATGQRCRKIESRYRSEVTVRAPLRSGPPPPLAVAVSGELWLWWNPGDQRTVTKRIAIFDGLSQPRDDAEAPAGAIQLSMQCRTKPDIWTGRDELGGYEGCASRQSLLSGFARAGVRLRDDLRPCRFGAYYKHPSRGVASTSVFRAGSRVRTMVDQPRTLSVRKATHSGNHSPQDNAKCPFFGRVRQGVFGSWRAPCGA